MYPLLQLNDLQIDFDTVAGRVTAVRDITLTINRGEIMGIAGESGSGKSVMALAVLQLLSSPPARYVSGEIFFSPDGRSRVNMLALEPRQLRAVRGRGITIIFQEPMTSLNPVFTCGSQVAEAVRLHQGLGQGPARKRTLELFEKVQLPNPAGIFQRYPHQLSGGQKQRVMIALAMSGNPALLICDEPTTALDVTVQRTILRLITDLQAETGMGVIFISHDLAVIAEIAHRAVIMRNGTLVEQGPLPALFRYPSHPYTRSLLACRPALYAKGARLPTPDSVLGESTFLSSSPPNSSLPPAPSLAGPFRPSAPATLSELSFTTDLPSPPRSFLPPGPFLPPAFSSSAASTQPSASSSPVGSTQLSTPSSSAESFLLPEPNLPAYPTPQPLFRVTALEVGYPAKKDWTGRARTYQMAVSGVSFEVHQGETLGLVGESGCGKSTLGRALLGLVKPRAGKILYKGEDLATIHGKALKRFRRNVQIVFQDPYSSLNPSLTAGSALEEPLRIHEPTLTQVQREQRVRDLLQKVQLSPEHYHRYPHEFSGGQRQRLVIARALICQPEFIACDESVSALDLSVQAQVLNLLNELKDEFGFTCLFISHDLAVVQYISDRIIVMHKGAIEEIGPSAQVYRHPASPYTRQLLAAMPSL